MGTYFNRKFCIPKVTLQTGDCSSGNLVFDLASLVSKELFIVVVIEMSKLVIDLSVVPFSDYYIVVA